jgi:hypothetical protein
LHVIENGHWRRGRQRWAGAVVLAFGSRDERRLWRSAKVCLFEIVGREGGGMVGSVSRTRSRAERSVTLDRVGGGSGPPSTGELSPRRTSLPGAGVHRNSRSMAAARSSVPSWSTTSSTSIACLSTPSS